jgi:glucosamine-phosphate N-acetyltransferase
MALATSPFTPDSELDLLFSPDFISQEVKSQLHPAVHVRRVTHIIAF